MVDSNTQLVQFILNWQDELPSVKSVFLHFKETLESLDNTVVELVAREGLTFSLRTRHFNQRNRPLFSIIDVIEGEPRWLSVCFYADMVSDPDELGDFVPGGILGEDAICFDVTENDKAFIQYLDIRITEAYSKAKEKY